jgi:hypothetical protein
VHLKLEDGSDYPYAGTIEFSEVSVDENAGTVVLRARIPNPQRMLLPGMFVRIETPQGIVPNAVLAPQQGIIRDTKGDPYALVVDAQNKVVQRKIKPVKAVGNMWVVSEGLKPGDHLIVQGTDKALPGATVKPTLVKIGVDPMSISRFFIDRPIFAWVVAIAIMLAGIGAILSLPIEQYPDVSPRDRHHRDLSGRFGRDAGIQRHPDHRAAADRRRQSAVLLLHLLGLGSGDDHRHLRQGHQPGYGAGAGAEQGAAGHIAPAHRSAAARRDRHQGRRRLPDGGRPL